MDAFLESRQGFQRYHQHCDHDHLRPGTDGAPRRGFRRGGPERYLQGIHRSTYLTGTAFKSLSWRLTWIILFQFVMVHQDLLRIVIGKNSLLASLPVGDAIASVLRTLEGGVDEVAKKIIELVPTCAEQAKKDLGDLDDTIGKAIDTYSS